MIIGHCLSYKLLLSTKLIVHYLIFTSKTLDSVILICDVTESKIASEMPIFHSRGKQFSTPRDIEEVKQFKDWETFRVDSVSFVKVQIISRL